MFLKLPKTRVVNPTEFATTTVTGGVVYTRAVTAAAVVPTRAEYKRRLLDRPPRRGPTRVTYFTRRTLRLGTPPAVVTPPRGWLQFFQGKVNNPVVTTRVCHRRHRRFTRWATTRRVGYTAGVLSGYRPRRQTDPLLGVYHWFHRGGPSWLVPTGVQIQPDRLVHRLSRLYRRRRAHRRQLAQLTRLQGYRHLLWGRRRRKLPLGQKRYHHLRRRRLRAYLVTGVAPTSPLRGTTRERYRRSNSNRFARLERADLLGGDSYLPQLAEWSSHTFDSRIVRPIEYNYNYPDRGYHKLQKKRRPGARRWKLLQHPYLATPFREVAQLRATWWKSTALGQRLTTPTEVDHQVMPLVGGFFSAVYWSFHRWGRSRWRTRPVRRATRVFVQSVKSGSAREHDAGDAWGTASSAPTGVLQSLQLENEVLQPPSYRPLFSLSRPLRRRRWRTQATRVVAWFSRAVWRWVVTPVWTPYAWVGVTLCWLAWRIRQVAWFLMGTAVAATTFVIHLVFRQLFRPAGQYLTHWVKERRVVKTAAWVWTSWLLAYTTDNQQAELEVNQMEDDGYNILLEEEFDLATEHEQDYDQLGEGVHTQQPQLTPFTNRWYKDWDSFWDDLLESGDDFFFSEVPHRLGLLARPWVDFLVRLPLWGLAEGVTLVVLTAKLEYHHRWHSLLTRGDTPGRVRGRWWKLPVVAVVCLLRWVPPVVVCWGIFTQLDYSTLRVTVCYTWGLAWREEYFVTWFLFSGLSAVALVGPAGWKHFLFQELGLANLLGIYLAGTEATFPEDYYPARPVSLVERLHQTTHTAPPKSGVEIDWWGVDRPDTGSGAGWSSYDEARLVVARQYGYDSAPYDPEMDLDALWFVFPPHLAFQENAPMYHKDVFVPSPLLRAYRDTHGVRINQYDLPFNMDTPSLWDISPPRDWTNNHRDERQRHYLDHSGVAPSDQLDEF